MKSRNDLLVKRLTSVKKCYRSGFCIHIDTKAKEKWD